MNLYLLLARIRRTVASTRFPPLACVALPLSLAAAGNAASSPDAPVRDPNLWLETSLEPGAPYVQAQALFTLRLYQAVGVRDLQFHGPTATLADIRPLADEQVDEVNREGRRYRVTERRYAVFPFASGDMTLSGAHVTGQTSSPGTNPPALQARRLDTPATPLSVLPIPPRAGAATWLPARALTLTETWTPEPGEARAGQALRRTIRIEAHGLDAAQLPALPTNGAGFSAHPEAPRLDNRFDAMWNVGSREQSWLIVPKQAGPLTLPALQLPWWDVLAHTPRVATLPARTLAVAAASEPEMPSGTSDAPAIEHSPTTGPTGQHDAPMAQAALVASALAASLALSAYLLVVWRRRTAAWRALRTACRRNDAYAAHRALLHWAALRWPARPPRSIGELAVDLPDTELRTALAALDRHLYGPPGQTPWNGQELLASLDRCKPAQKHRTPALPPLYPA